jgi:hypothetical protein
MKSDLKGVMIELMRFALILAIIAMFCLDVILFHVTYNDPLNQKVVDAGNPIITKEESRRAERKFGSKTGLECLCRTWGYYDPKTGYFWKVKP